MKGTRIMKHFFTRSLSLLAATVLLPALPATAPSADKSGEVIHIFNGKDLTNFYTYLAAPAPGKKPYGKNNDPENVFTVHDRAIHISGKVYGGLITEKEYGDYHLVTEFKWGTKTWAPRKDRARDSGILLHCTGADGGVGGVWMEAIECQMIEGGTGDFILVGGKEKRRLTVEAEKRDGQVYFKPGSSPITLESGRFNWWGRDPAWKDVAGYRGEQDVEKPLGHWNTLECICEGHNLTNILNGKIVNAGTRCSHARGKILFQSEGAEVFFRKIDLIPSEK
jgi:hypothetical protein